MPSTQVGYRPINGNDPAKLEPERATEFETGIDLGFFEGRVNLEASFYNKLVKNLISPFATAPGTGVAAVRAYPVGDLQNRGIELSLGVVPVKTANFVWNSSTSFWFNRSLVTRLTVPEIDLNPGFGANYGTTYFAEGESPTRWYGRPRIDPTKLDTRANLTRYGDAQPTFQMSYQNTFTIFRNLELGFLLHWKKDGYTSNLTITNQDGFGTSKDWSDSYTAKDGSVGPIGEARQAFAAEYFVQNSGYVRLREVSIYYSVPAAIRSSLFKDYVKNIRIGASGNNLLTWTNYRGYDPEVSNFGATNTQAQVDVVGYPSTKRVFFHINLDF